MEFASNILKQFNCSSCTQHEFEELNDDDFKDWSLFLKEHELYTSMILYNEKTDKDISSLLNKDDSVILYKNNDEIFIKLEYIVNDNNNAILVPTDEYHSVYENIVNMDKKFNKKINAYFIDKFDLKKI